MATKATKSVMKMILMISRILFTSSGASSFICAINPLAWTSSPQMPAYAILQPARFTKADESLRRWWALTPPFHPCLCSVMKLSHRRFKFLQHCLSCKTCLPFGKCGALRCPDFPLPSGSDEVTIIFQFNPKEQSIVPTYHCVQW